MKLTLVAGARPNFVKIAALVEALEAAKHKSPISYRLVHTGQHYDPNLSDSFFADLEIPMPDVNLGVGSGTQAEQTAGIMVAFERDLMQNPCDAVIVVGDVNSTMACTIVAKKMNTIVCHVEAGIRSGDMSMPEEINRIVTDSIADVFFTTTHAAGMNLVKQGVPASRIHFVGNTMIDTLIRHAHRFRTPQLKSPAVDSGAYIVVTLHRPSNVDNPDYLLRLLKEIVAGAQSLPVVFPVHPRTSKALSEMEIPSGIHLTHPLPYLEFMYLVKGSAGVVTDSGGIQEETTFLGIPCITLRNSTERPETVTMGTNELIGDSMESIRSSLNLVVAGNWKRGTIPELWDGQASYRIVEVLRSLIK